MHRHEYNKFDEEEFTRKSKKPMKPKPDVSMFGQSSGLEDVTLIVEGIRIPVIKALLSLTSPVFRAMFGGEWKEKFQNEIPLPGKKVETFIPFLRCIYPDLMDRVTAETAIGILPLAWEYQIVKLTEQCEDCH
ncbi:hypothetical protein DPMN_093659 [Dreissena polymorpha]|uniref:BTB domain-containing protein n=1 Tax=Dreissena polymorpha TaxID=45954 RepID=A0A9D4L4K9_DREPO|nr:hypothetical protein DPMN_093659 [Dreissena polymorpha]